MTFTNKTLEIIALVGMLTGLATYLLAISALMGML